MAAEWWLTYTTTEDDGQQKAVTLGRVTSDWLTGHCQRHFLKGAEFHTAPDVSSLVIEKDADGNWVRWYTLQVAGPDGDRD